jgi:hypothetical protein
VKAVRARRGFPDLESEPVRFRLGLVAADAPCGVVAAPPAAAAATGGPEAPGEFPRGPGAAVSSTGDASASAVPGQPDPRAPRPPPPRASSAQRARASRPSSSSSGASSPLSALGLRPPPLL